MGYMLDPLLHIFFPSQVPDFSKELNQLSDTIQRAAPMIQNIIDVNRELGLPQTDFKMFREAEILFNECSKMTWNTPKRSLTKYTLRRFNRKSVQFFQKEVEEMHTRAILEMRAISEKRAISEMLRVKHEKEEEMRMLRVKLEKEEEMRMLRVKHEKEEEMRMLRVKHEKEVEEMQTRAISEMLRVKHEKEVEEMQTRAISEMLSVKHVKEKVEREKYGWRVPALPSGIVAFDELLQKLKAEVVAGIDRYDDDYRSVLVVTAASGCGKTTLVKMLCHDTGIREKFGENIFFVAVSETPNFIMIVNDLFNPKSSSLQVVYQSNEDAKKKLNNFLNPKVSGPMLVVLDDVWSDSFIENFPSKNRGCKILVTSRTAFPNHNYDVFQFDPLNEKDAKTLFCQSAFTKGGRRPTPTINDKLVNQIATCCEKHALTLCVVGRSLNGKDESVWEYMLKKLSGGKSVLDLPKDHHVHIGLERSFEALDDELKQCFLDFGLFPEDQRIPVSALLNMWVHLYNHDDDGVDTLVKIFELSYRNLVGNDLGASVTFCDKQFVTQHDLLRELAIHLNSKQSVAQRRRLIINAQGQDLPASVQQVQEPMQACMLSISTGESFSSQWCNMKVPDVEVLVLNLMSKTYTLPHFLAGMPKLKILNVTNHGSYPTEFEDSHLLSCSYNLTRIRLERVAISTSIFALVNLQKVSFIMCKIGNAFEKLSPNILPQLLELEIDSCQDLVEFPGILCTSLHLKKLSITNCIQMSVLLPEAFANLASLETLCLRSCTKLEKLPESISRLQKLSVLDISDCSSLSKLPDQIGKLGALRVIYMTGCMGLPDQLPPSVKDLSHTYVVCNEEISYQWQEFRNVEIYLVEEDEDNLEALKIV